MKINNSQFTIYLYSFLLTLFIVHFSYGLSILNPTNINWLMSVHHDWGTHYLGWAFYKDDPWTFPLGFTESYNFPLGTNVGFTDSIPLLALIFKPFSSFLPEDFQYFGFWLFLCHFLIAVFTFKIFNLYNVNKWFTVLAVIIVSANPVLIFRCLHPALCAHFLIVASIYNYLKASDKINSDRINIFQIILFFIAGAVNPYITMMVFGFNIILPLKHYVIDKSISAKKLFLFPILSITLVVLFWIVFGMVELNNSTDLASAERFNFFSFNLNSFFNSYGYYSKFLPDYGKTDSRQYEGFAYLGVGMILMILFNLIFIIKSVYKKQLKLKITNKYLLLFSLCLILFLYAITNEITYGTLTILKLPLPKIIEKLGFVFRASGRFAWTMYYCIFIFSLLLFTRININKYFKIAILVVLTSIQLYDIQNLFSQWNLPTGAYETPLSNKKWILAINKFDNVIIYPPFNYNYSMTYNMDYQDVCYLALKAKRPISNGYVARTNIKKSEYFTTHLKEELNRGEIDSNRLYITTNEYIGDFDVLIKANKVNIQKMDKFIFIFSNKKNTLNSNNFENDSKTLFYIDSVKTYFKKHKVLNFSIFDKKIINNSNIQFYIDNFNFNSNLIQLRGWAFLKSTNNNKGDSIYLSLKNKGKMFFIPMKIDKRNDITTSFKKEYLDDAGFYSAISTRGIPKESYEIGIIIKDKIKNYNYVKSDKIITIK